jgi:hypothetical protein
LAQTERGKLIDWDTANFGSRQQATEDLGAIWWFVAELDRRCRRSRRSSKITADV